MIPKPKVGQLWQCRNQQYTSRVTCINEHGTFGTVFGTNGVNGDVSWGNVGFAHRVGPEAHKDIHVIDDGETEYDLVNLIYDPSSDH